MQFTAAAVAALAFVQAAVAAPSTAPVAIRDAHELDFRSFGVEGCHDDNQGVWTLTESANTRCTRFTEAVGSILVADNLCTLTFYTDAECSVGGVVAPTNVCQNGAWQSFQMIC
ncbi:hypothetical protein F503_05997 [Ophiostoma piceae UAMH 11346]|uniref:Uncharacterized protein n=1 Tax=Ophiostoma piceae (strain UAMH 11346) TaxID=1262450 RepID=S3CD95_OPHP1|nr:hypothetical protein F503_05997 [Ophiostoma piceae UAMH 11346]